MKSAKENRNILRRFFSQYAIASKLNERRLILVLFSLMTLVTLALAIPGLYYSFNAYRKASHIFAINEIATYSLTTVKNFAFERGRTNVVLRNPDPVSAKNREFIDGRRKLADLALTKVIQISQKEFPEETAKIDAAWVKVQDLRRQIDEELKRPLAERKTVSPQTWLAAANGLIEAIELMLFTSAQIEDANSKFSHYANMRIHSLEFRNVVGAESSLLSSTISAGKIPDQAALHESELLLGQSQQLWSHIEITGRLLNNKEIDISFNAVQESFFKGLRPLEDQYREALRTGQKPSLPLDTYLSSSVKALDSIVEMTDAVDRDANNYARRQLRSALLLMMANLAGLAAVIVIFFLIRRTLIRRFAVPLRNIIIRIRKLRGEHPKELPPGKSDLANVNQALDLLEHTLQELQDAKCEAEHRALHDQLTGLPTYRLASDRLDMAIEAAKRSGKKVAVLFLDLDGFKPVNDVYGHEAGDHVLREISERIVKTIRKTDTASRIGGDEFLVILPELPEVSIALETARRLIAAISATIPFGENQLSVGVSIGISIFPDHASDAKQLRAFADEAMYSVKNSGKNNFCCFSNKQLTEK
ncbi:MAG: GGDEF domain-containing protein [Pseudomonadota bacterium]|nr:GGDEF domain-containing protein [Pseudomonadota bacterium]